MSQALESDLMWRHWRFPMIKGCIRSQVKSHVFNTTWSNGRQHLYINLKVVGLGDGSNPDSQLQGVASRALNHQDGDRVPFLPACKDGSAVAAEGDLPTLTLVEVECDGRSVGCNGE